VESFNWLSIINLINNVYGVFLNHVYGVFLNHYQPFIFEIGIMGRSVIMCNFKQKVSD